MNVRRTLKTFGATLYKNRARIATVTGMVCVAGGTALVISKAKKATEVANEVEIQVKEIRKKDAEDSWVDKKERSDARLQMVKTAVKGYTKTYWLGILIELVGLGLITWSDVQQCKDISAMSALASGYAATIAAIKERVIEDQGEAKWEEYLLGPQVTKVEVLEDGTVVQSTKPIENPNRHCNLPPHCYLFDEFNPNWEPDARCNMDFLETKLIFLNRLLKKDGFLFENDIRKAIGAPIVKSGYTSGILAEYIDPETGDKIENRLTFGLEAKTERAQAFRDGVEPSIILMFNLEDNIIDKLNLSLS